MRYGLTNDLVDRELSTYDFKALAMALFEDEDYENRQQGLFLRGDECLVKGICFMGTPFQGSGTANSLTPFVKALAEVNFLTAVNATLVGTLRENYRESVELRNIVQRFKTIAENRSIRLLIGCESKPVMGSNLVRKNLYGILLFLLKMSINKALNANYGLVPRSSVASQQ